MIVLAAVALCVTVIVALMLPLWLPDMDTARRAQRRYDRAEARARRSAS